MLRSFLRGLLSIMVTLAIARTGHAQFGVNGYPLASANAANNVSGVRLFLQENTDTPTGCGAGTARFATVSPGTPFGSTDYGGPSAYYVVSPQGQSFPQFYVTLEFEDETGIPYEFGTWMNAPTVEVYLDGAPCANCGQASAGLIWSYWWPERANISLNYPGANSYDMPDGAHEYSIRYYRGNNAICDFRFKVVVLGTVYSQVLGYFNAPALPLYILRDPPGDASYASLTQSNGACFGQTTSATTGSTENGYFKARIGVAGTIGLVVTTNYEIYGELGVDLTASRSQTATEEYLTCLETTSEFTTPMTGPPDDVFIGSSIRYAYGVAKIVSRPTCDSIAREVRLAMTPVQVLSSYNYTESHVRNTVMPQLQQLIGTLTPGTEPYKTAVDQLSVWQQLLDMNDAIKAEAALEVTRTFNGGGNGQSYSITQNTTQTKSIEYSAALDGGLSFEVGVHIGGSGITAGGRVGMQSAYGSSQSASNSTTNTMTYHLEDDDAGDNFNVQVRRDPVFGTYVFVLDSALSATSCEYEGGYHIDQPSLSVGAPGQSHMVLNEVPIGGGASFPLYVCNNSNVSRTYFLKFRTNSNTEGGILNAFGNILNSNDNGLEIDLAAGECLNAANLVLTQPGTPVGPDYTIELYLYSLCEPAISSSITIEAHFGVGNIGGYCEPSSANGPSQGDFVDGVQLMGISNLSSGSVAGAAYSDLSGQYQTALSRGAQRMITITCGPNVGDRYAVWIDWDRNSQFGAAEKIGEFTSVAAGEVHDLTFSVPANASLGNTVMRVRAAKVGNGEPGTLDACYNYALGETEDYRISVNANAPLDCAGVQNGGALPGTACNDGNTGTGNDTWNANCTCIGVPVDCAGVPGGTTLPGTDCDDNNAQTANDAYGANCICAGVPYDCVGVPGGAALPGSACDDGDAGTGNDAFTADCTCAGALIDCIGNVGGTALPGVTCDDGNPLSGGDVYGANCLCAGLYATDCMGVANGSAQPGTPCNDGDEDTGNDVYGLNCICAGEPYDCTGVPGGAQLPGTPCSDGNPQTTDDVFTTGCACFGVLPIDCAGVPGGTAQPGTVCDDGNADTGNDRYSVFCQCAGVPIDCNNVPGGLALPGFPCDDGNAGTVGDTLSNACVCAGLLLDCLNQPGGGALPGAACDDGDPDTGNDVYNANCVCAGTLDNDCNGTPGGNAQPGTPCDDGDVTTGNDTWSVGCACVGQPIDCANVPGGAALPGTACNDAIDCTVNDVWSNACVCAGTTVAIGSVSGPTGIDVESTNVYFVTPMPGATSYSWELPAGWTSANTNEFVLMAMAGTATGDVQVCVHAMVDACELTSCATVMVTGPSAITENTGTSWITAQPNPCSGLFRIQGEQGRAIAYEVRDGLGRSVQARQQLPATGTAVLDLSQLADGAYYLMATDGKDQRVIKLMVQH